MCSLPEIECRCASGISSYGFLLSVFSNQLILAGVLCVNAEPVGGEDNPDSGAESSRHLPLV